MALVVMKGLKWKIDVVGVVMVTLPGGDWSSSTLAFSSETGAILFVRLSSKL